MKKSIMILVILFSVGSLAANAQDQIIGEKSKPGSANPQINKAFLAKWKSEIEKYYTVYARKQAEAESAADALRKKIEEAMKAMESDNKMSNFEIQNLMSAFNQAETLSSQVQKKREETKKAVIGKL